jgi:peptidoglycan/xylan/chitin deacetylase (PgdA/CDA1 family)
MAYLQITIDDGPAPVKPALAPILAELARRKVSAAFFNLGQEVKANPSAALDICGKGHVLANHSWDHLMPTVAKYTDEQIVDQFQRTQDIVRETTDEIMRHWRCPRIGAKDIRRLTGLLVGEGKIFSLQHCDVHADSKDSQNVSSAEGMLAALRAEINTHPARSTFRLLFHVKIETGKALPAVLDGLVEDGHTLVDFTQTS